MSGALLEVGISAGYGQGPDVLREFELEVRAGEAAGLVGHSGSGKSTASLAILQLLWVKGGVSRGYVRFEGRDLMRAGEAEMRKLRGREMALVSQSPVAALNPSMRIEAQFREAWRAHAARQGAARERETFLEMLKLVNLPAEPRLLESYPSQVSVGQAQRLLIALAIMHRPKLLIADEPTSALDPITQAEILELFSQLSRRLGMALLYISHDLVSVSALCQRVAILHEGRVVECGETERIFAAPAHPYTQRLVATLARARRPLAGALVAAR